MAASVTVLAIGPAVSWVAEIGIMPVRLHNPTVGFIPTRPLIDEGETMEPLVSVPMPNTLKFAAMEEPVPELEFGSFYRPGLQILSK